MISWISIFFSYLFSTSGATKRLAEKVFDLLRKYWTSKTTNVVDDVLLTLVEAIALQKYVTTGTGQMEAVLKYLLPKATPWARYALWWALDFVYQWSLKNKIEGDEKAFLSIRDFVFPEGAPERPDFPWENIQTDAEVAAKEIPDAVEAYPETSTAPGVGGSMKD